MRLALFDLDHTLLPIDSDHSWGEFTTQIGWTDAAEFGRRNDIFYAQYKEGKLDVHEYIRFATEPIRRHGLAAALRARAHFMQQVIEPALRRPALDLVRRHQQAGDQVIIVTATNEFITRPIADRFEVEELIAVQLECDGAGEFTGAIQGTPSFRDGKVKRMDEWLTTHGLSWVDLESSVFYSDSTNDLALLERVGEPVATNPDPVLRELATRRGWRILELFAEPIGIMGDRHPSDDQETH